MKTVVSMGVHILDVLGRHVSEIPPGQNIALIDEIRITAAGTAAGTSVDMAKLGCKVVAVGAAGDDEMGNVLLGIMNRYGIDTSHMKRKKGVQTSGTMLPIRPNGERPALHVMGTNATFCFEDVPQDVIPENKSGCEEQAVPSHGKVADPEDLRINVPRNYLKLHRYSVWDTNLNKKATG
jgi:sugar/nucleoside kinase (ribokinase family)